MEDEYEINTKKLYFQWEPPKTNPEIAMNEPVHYCIGIESSESSIDFNNESSYDNHISSERKSPRIINDFDI